MNLTDLERSVLSWFAERNGSLALRSQCDSAFAESRTHTGPGQTTRLRCAQEATCADFPTACVPNAPLISSPVLPHGAGADLWIKDGKLAELEVVSFGGTELPTEPFQFTLVEAL